MNYQLCAKINFSSFRSGKVRKSVQIAEVAQWVPIAKCNRGRVNIFLSAEPKYNIKFTQEEHVKKIKVTKSVQIAEVAQWVPISNLIGTG